MLSKEFSITAMLVLLWAPLAAARETGQIEGRVTTPDGSGIGGVSVTLLELSARRLTAGDGRFVIDRLAPGAYSLTFALGAGSVTETGVRVEAGATTTVDRTIDWVISFADQLTVYSASRRRERIVEAPAAVTTISPEGIELGAPSGQLPKLLEFTVGVELTQNGVYDFNLNVRGFNNSINTRVQTLIDGRNPSNPFASYVEWMPLDFLSEDLASVELVRGPSAALYGANTFNGVLNMVTLAPRDSQGGRLRLTAGELETGKADLRWAGALGGEWYVKLLGSYSESNDFSRSRNENVEYGGLSLEAIPIPVETIEITSGLVRFDKHFSGNRALVLESAVSQARGFTLLIPFGRGHSPKTERKWARLNYGSPSWNVLGTYNTRESIDQLALGTGDVSTEDHFNYQVEFQGNREFADGRGRLVGGISYGEEEVDTANLEGIQSLLAEPVHSDREAAFGQLDYDLSTELKAVVAARWDDSSLHEAELSPKASLVYSPAPGHNLRLSYNEAFQVGTYIELFLQAAIAPPLDLSAFESELAPLLGGVSLGLESVPLLGRGNEHLRVEKIRGFELGYNGVLSDKLFVTLDYYDNDMEDFLTDLLPGVNPAYPAYSVPAGVPASTAAIVETILNEALAGLTNDDEGRPQIVLSYGNTGRVDSRGVELSLSYAISGGWLFDFNYSWFDFEVKELAQGTAVHPNAPEHKFGFGLTYRKDRLNADLRYRWMDDFDWSSGLFVGPVPSFQVVHLSANYELSENWLLGLYVSNLLNDRHYEAFGGSILERRALVSATVTW